LSRAEELAALTEACRNKIVLELGSAYGGSTLAIAESAKIVHAVDWHYGDPHLGEGDTLLQYLANVRDRPNVVTHLGRFENVVPAFALGHFQVAFIDGYHTYDQVKADIALVLPRLTERGMLIFHDYGLRDGTFNVTDAVDERFTVTELVHTMAFVKNARHSKPKESA
jgi:predicted O-methyltransferase YrrM